MKSNDITGGVSPLKAKNLRTAGRGSKHARPATATARRRGGFSKSKGVRGGGGRNVAGYNVQTRFKADKWVKPPSGGTTRIDTTKTKPYSYDKDGKLQINNADASASASASAGTEGYWVYKDVETFGSLDSYKKTYDRNDKGVKDKYATLEEYETAAEKWWDDETAKYNKENSTSISKEEFKKTYKTKKTERVKDYYVPGTSSSSSSSSGY